MAAIETSGGHFGGTRDWRAAVSRSVAVVRANPALVLAVALVLLIEVAAADAETEARRAAQIFTIALVGWTLTRLDDAFVALVAAIAMAALVLDEPDELFEGLGDELIWLMLASFLLAAAFKATGLAGRLAQAAVGRARTVRGAFHALTLAMLATAFLVPSTSGRAALMVPVFEGVAGPANERLRKAFALLFPTVILLSAFASLTGAGAHVLAAELLDETADAEIGFLEWALYGLPFAAACSFLAAEAILRLFAKDDAGAPFRAPQIAAETSETRAWPVVAIFALVILGWLTEPLHDVDETLVALIGACAAVAPGVGGISFKAAVRQVEWPLMLFMAATVVIAEGLSDSGLVRAAADGALAPLGELGLPPLVWLVAIAGVGLASHLLIHSRTARVAVLLPPALAAAEAADVAPTAVALTLVAATGFCQLLMVSAKPVALFGALPGGTFGQSDLLRLGAVLAPLQLVLVALFAGLIWPLLGLDLAD